MVQKRYLLIMVLFSLISVRPVNAQQDTDRFLWLEDVGSEKALDWVKVHNEKTIAELKKNPVFDEVYDKTLEVLNSKEKIAYPGFQGKYLYNFWQDENNERGLWRRTTLEKYLMTGTKWEIILDIDSLSKAEGVKWVYKGSQALYPDYNLALVSLSRGGGDAVEVREFDINKKQFIKDGFFLPESKCSLSWIDANTLYIGTDFGPGSMTESGYPSIVKVWKRGTPLKEAVTVYEGKTTDVSSSGYVVNTPERKYQFISRGITFYTRDTYAVENGKLIKLDIPADADFNGIFQNKMLLMLKTDWNTGGKNYKQGSLLSIDYNKFMNGARDFSVVAAPEERLSIESVSYTKNFLLVTVLDNVRSKIFKYTYDGSNWNKEKIDAPDFGTLGIIATDDEYSDQYFFSYTGFLNPTSLYFVSDKGDIKKIKSLPEFFNTADLKVDQYEAVSKDGVKIPYFVVHSKEMKTDGTNPALIYAYGGFEVPTLPSYSATMGTAWLKRSGVYVVANIRGGGEFGPNWHLSAIKENRQKVNDDLIAVSEDLIKRKITAPAHLGIRGGSNGGLLVGSVFTQRPELFNAVVCQVPLLDMKRYNKLLAGASWMGEYGNPDLPEEWAYISKYSPYQNLSADKKYPKVFFLTSTRDDRVHPGHARKMAAKMESLGKEFYYFENTEGGHAAAVTNKQSAFSNALIYAYLLQQLK